MNNIPYCPILKPTEEQFSNFEAYVTQIYQNYSNDYGFVKVIPPQNWKARQNDYDNEIIDQIILKNPIEQNIQGKEGIYELLMMQKQTLNLGQYRKKVINQDKMTDFKDIEEVEKLFWKNLSFSPIIYGADILESIFDYETPWNLANLQTILSEGLKDMQIPGINSPYLYAGCWKSMFGWHTEDYDLLSINFLHLGKPKFWYGLPANYSQIYKDFCKTIYKDGFQNCSEFMRHKTVVLNPYLSKQKLPQLNFSKMIQYPGEFMITFMNAFHSGFNWGYNLAEAVNFGTLDWLQYFFNAKVYINQKYKELSM